MISFLPSCERSFCFRVFVFLEDGDHETSHSSPTEWIYIAMNCIGPNDNEGIRMFINGVEVASDTKRGIISLLTHP